MSHLHFSPHTHGDRACWHCQHFGAMVYSGTAAWCARPGAVPVTAAPARGCAFWSREPGADDEAGPPPPREIVQVRSEHAIAAQRTPLRHSHGGIGASSAQSPALAARAAASSSNTAGSCAKPR